MRIATIAAVRFLLLKIDGLLPLPLERWRRLTIQGASLSNAIPAIIAIGGTAGIQYLGSCRLPAGIVAYISTHDIDK